MVSFQKPLCKGLTPLLHLDTFCLMVTVWNVSRISANRKLALDVGRQQRPGPLKRCVLGNIPRSQASLRSYLNMVTRSCMSHGQAWFIFWPSNCRKPPSISIFVTDDKVLLRRYLPDVFDFSAYEVNTWGFRKTSAGEGWRCRGRGPPLSRGIELSSKQAGVSVISSNLMYQLLCSQKVLTF